MSPMPMSSIPLSSIPGLEILGDFFEHAQNSQYILFYKAELYNKKELLRKHGVLEPGTNFGDLVFCLYQKLGLDFVKELDGKFAIILFDKIRRQIFVIRDIFASVPVYFFNSKAKLYFSSEIRNIADRFNLNFDYNFLGQYLSSNIISSEQTIYSDVKRAPPGYISVFSQNTLNNRYGFTLTDKYSYWAPPVEENLSREESLFLIRNSFTNSLQKRLEFLDKAALSLSGGLDSGIVFSWIKNNFPAFSLSPFTSTFLGCNCDESKEVKELLSFFQSSGNFVEPKSISSNFLDNEISHWAEIPNYPTGFYLDYLKSKISENGYKDIITAYGADEIFSAREEISLSSLPLSMRNCLSSFFPKSFKSFLKDKKIIKDWIPSYLTKKFKDDTRIDYTLKNSSNIDTNLSKAKRLAAKDLFGSWAVHLRELEVRAAGKFSLNLHSPFLDKELIETYFKVPSKYAWDRRYFQKKKFIHKKLAREALGVYLPKSYSTSSSNAEFSEVSFEVLLKQLKNSNYHFKNEFQNLEDLGWIDKNEINNIFGGSFGIKRTNNFWSLWTLLGAERILERKKQR